MRLAATVSTALVFAGVSSAHWAPQIPHHNARHAVNKVWCGNSNYYCATADTAWAIAGCETGKTWNIWASNGQYKGLFQMGSSERRRFGHAWNPWGQARAAWRYWRVSGWSPWSCAYILGIL